MKAILFKEPILFVHYSTTKKINGIIHRIQNWVINYSSEMRRKKWISDIWIKSDVKYESVNISKEQTRDKIITKVTNMQKPNVFNYLHSHRFLLVP